MIIKSYNSKLIHSDYVQNLYILDTCSSTLDIAQQCLEDKSLILAEMQTAGRGQYQRKWQSPKLSGIWGCYIIKQNINALAIRAALAIVSSLKQLGCQQQIKIKWPNDIYINDLKTAGILIEGISIGKTQYWCIGFGITYKKISEQNTTSLCEQWPKACHRELLINTWLNNLYKSFTKDDIRSDFMPYDMLYQQAAHGGIANGITKNGELILIKDNQKIILSRSPENHHQPKS